MKTIYVLVKISTVDGWDVDWTDEQEKASELKQLTRDIERIISIDLGISLMNVDAKIESTE